MSTNGKGSKPRPFSVSREEFNSTWDNIFKKIPKEDKEVVKKKKPSTNELK
jgi:hypothetical protein